ncbi:hypothetical protein [Corynebacterium halotolerans]|uniref:Uncharacterized protein n=1 Tax=Corynebacterium halotolerans YIM 70093 = DSM 44683 TaxID=1121362 RepID=M1NVQ1_9CORY|nr:hypothetical protein [Corynebacterium halotolerans]AGF71570.1 hypothetical protein A605_02780 [Corynebacterium halotolerans YIM 70093 = DSM 44683]
MDTFDPLHLDRHLCDGEPDPARYPVHPAGTWERAMLFMSLGYRPAREDVEDLERWSRLGPGERHTALAKHRRTMRAITTAAGKELATGEVESSTRLARRLAGYPGVPHATRTMALLKTVPHVPLGAMGSGGELRRLYLPRASGSPGHFLSFSTRALREFPEVYAQRRSAQRRDILTNYWSQVHDGQRPGPDHSERKSA